MDAFETDEREREYAEHMRHFLLPLMAFFADDDVSEVYVNPGDGRVWTERHSIGRRCEGFGLPAEKVRAFLNACADRKEETIGGRREHIQAQLPRLHFGGARLQGFLPRVVERPSFVIRKRPSRLFALGEYVASGILAPAHEATIRAAIAERKNILVAGGTRSGKTTLVNAILKAMTDRGPGERFMILEDTPELWCEAADCCRMQTTLSLGLEELVKLTLRASPDRIVVGEVRDGAALHLMDAWVTGHPGGTGTVHATTALGALRRMERLARRAAPSNQSELVAEAIDLVVVIAYRGGVRRVTEVVEVASDLAADGSFQVAPARAQPVSRRSENEVEANTPPQG